MVLRVCYLAGLIAGLVISGSQLSGGEHETSRHKETFVHALDCLQNGDNDWFAPTFANQSLLQLRYVKWSPDPDFSDRDSLFVAAYRKGHRQGEVVHLLVYENRGRQSFYIVNNTRFTRKAGSYDLHSALGGLWTEGRIIRALKQMERISDIEISRDSIKKTSVICHWYGEKFEENGMDKKRKHNRRPPFIDGSAKRVAPPPARKGASK